jgi:hypothetical protein
MPQNDPRAWGYTSRGQQSGRLRLTKERTLAWQKSVSQCLRVQTADRPPDLLFIELKVFRIPPVKGIAVLSHGIHSVFLQIESISETTLRSGSFSNNLWRHFCNSHR